MKLDRTRWNLDISYLKSSLLVIYQWVRPSVRISTRIVNVGAKKNGNLAYEYILLIPARTTFMLQHVYNMLQWPEWSLYDSYTA